MSSESSEQAFELKGTAATITVLRLKTVAVDSIEADLKIRVAQLPHFFHSAPVILDVEEIAEDLDIPFKEIVAGIRRCKLVPVGVRNAKGRRLEQAIDAGLGELKGGGPALRAAPKPESKAPTPRSKDAGMAGPKDGEAPKTPMDPAPPRMSLTLRTPVRGGQVTYAPQTDLVILAPVNAGAEVIADGNIHIYAPLRGRALAGAHGNEEARIFCQSLDAELVSIAGTYLMADELPEDMRNKPVKIHLEGGKVVISPL